MTSFASHLSVRVHAAPEREDAGGELRRAERPCGRA